MKWVVHIANIGRPEGENNIRMDLIRTG